MRLPWLWLAIAFLVVLILAAVVYLAREALPTQLPVVEVTATPTVAQPSSTPEQAPLTPTPTSEAPTATPEPSPSKADIEPGIKVEVVGTGIDGLRIRSGPGLNYTSLKIVPDGETFTVLEGPEEADDLRWWRLKDEAGTIGWAAENYLQPMGQ